MALFNYNIPLSVLADKPDFVTDPQARRRMALAGYRASGQQNTWGKIAQFALPAAGAVAGSLIAPGMGTQIGASLGTMASSGMNRYARAQAEGVGADDALPALDAGLSQRAMIGGGITQAAGMLAPAMGRLFSGLGTPANAAPAEDAALNLLGQNGVSPQMLQGLMTGAGMAFAGGGKPKAKTEMSASSTATARPVVPQDYVIPSYYQQEQEEASKGAQFVRRWILGQGMQGRAGLTKADVPAMTAAIKTPQVEYSPGRFDRRHGESSGVYYQDQDRAYIKPQPQYPGATASTSVHESTHQWQRAMGDLGPAMHPAWQRSVERIESELGRSSRYKKAGQEDQQYYGDPTEVHSRLMELRYQLNLKPGQQLTPRTWADIQRRRQRDGEFSNTIKNLERVLDPEQVRGLLNSVVSNQMPADAAFMTAAAGGKFGQGYVRYGKDENHKEDLLMIDTASGEAVGAMRYGERIYDQAATDTIDAMVRRLGHKPDARGFEKLGRFVAGETVTHADMSAYAEGGKPKPQTPSAAASTTAVEKPAPNRKFIDSRNYYEPKNFLQAFINANEEGIRQAGYNPAEARKRVNLAEVKPFDAFDRLFLNKEVGGYYRPLSGNISIRDQRPQSSNYQTTAVHELTHAAGLDHYKDEGPTDPLSATMAKGKSAYINNGYEKTPRLMEYRHEAMLYPHQTVDVVGGAGEAEELLQYHNKYVPLSPEAARVRLRQEVNGLAGKRIPFADDKKRDTELSRLLGRNPRYAAGGKPTPNIRRAQEQLKAAGLYQGPVSGEWDEAMQGAIDAWNARQRNLPNPRKIGTSQAQDGTYDDVYFLGEEEPPKASVTASGDSLEKGLTLEIVKPRRRGMNLDPVMPEGPIEAPDAVKPRPFAVDDNVIRAVGLTPPAPATNYNPVRPQPQAPREPGYNPLNAGNIVDGVRVLTGLAAMQTKLPAQPDVSEWNRVLGGARSRSEDGLSAASRKLYGDAMADSRSAAYEALRRTGAGGSAGAALSAIGDINAAGNSAALQLAQVNNDAQRQNRADYLSLLGTDMNMSSQRFGQAYQQAALTRQIGANLANQGVQSIVERGDFYRNYQDPSSPYRRLLDAQIRAAEEAAQASRDVRRRTAQTFLNR